MKVEVLGGFDALDEQRWNGLVERSSSRSVFLTWQWQTSWTRAFADGRPLQILTVIDDGGALAGILPLYEGEAGGCRIVGGEDVSDYLDLIAAPGAEGAVWEALLQHRAAHPAVWALRGIRPESCTLTTLPSLVAAHGLRADAEVEERCP